MKGKLRSIPQPTRRSFQNNTSSSQARLSHNAISHQTGFYNEPSSKIRKQTTISLEINSPSSETRIKANVPAPETRKHSYVSSSETKKQSYVTSSETRNKVNVPPPETRKQSYVTASETRNKVNVPPQETRKYSYVSSSKTIKQSYVPSSSSSEAQASKNKSSSPIEFSLENYISQKMTSGEVAKLSIKEILLLIYFRLDSMNKNMEENFKSLNENIQKIMLKVSTSHSNSNSLKDSLEKSSSINAYKRGNKK